MIRLSTMTDERREVYMKYYKEVMLSGSTGFTYKEPDREFNEFGLRFDIDYLNAISWSVIFYPLELAAGYVDIVTKAMIDDKDEQFVWNQVIDEDYPIAPDLAGINATGIGNMAYVALNSHRETARRYAENILDKIFVIAKGKMLAMINEKYV